MHPQTIAEDNDQIAVYLGAAVSGHLVGDLLGEVGRNAFSPCVDCFGVRGSVLAGFGRESFVLQRCEIRNKGGVEMLPKMGECLRGRQSDDSREQIEEKRCGRGGNVVRERF
jgi:hypothetical protein